VVYGNLGWTDLLRFETALNGSLNPTSRWPKTANGTSENWMHATGRRSVMADGVTSSEALQLAQTALGKVNDLDQETETLQAQTRALHAEIMILEERLDEWEI
jgi:hypothetical protein